MFAFVLPLLFIFSLANAELVTVECSDGKAQFERADLRASKCLRIIQSEAISNPPNFYVLQLPEIDCRSVKLFIKLSKLNDDKIFAFIDSLTPDEFRVFNYGAKYLRCYHEFDALFKYKFLKEYGLVGARKELFDFVDAKFFQFKFINSRWQKITLFDLYCSQFSGQNPENSCSEDGRAFFVLIDFYQQVIKKPLSLSTQHLKNVFYAQPAYVQQTLLNKKLVTLP